MFALVSCGDDSDTKPQVNNANTTVDAGVDAEPDVAAVLMCPDEGEIFCGGRCINGQISMDHCGECENSCQIGAQTCRDGACACLSGRELCGSRCYDWTSSHDHCGSCDTKCSASEACVDSNCVFVNDRQEVLGVLEFTNKARALRQDCGIYGFKSPVGPLQLEEHLSIAAQGHAEDMAANNYFEHEGLDGRSPGERATDAGYPGQAGENIARGQASPEEAVIAWTESDGHCTNMMTDDYKELGVGYAVSSDGQKYWVQLFGVP